MVKTRKVGKALPTFATCMPITLCGKVAFAAVGCFPGNHCVILAALVPQIS